MKLDSTQSDFLTRTFPKNQKQKRRKYDDRLHAGGMKQKNCCIDSIEALSFIVPTFFCCVREKMRTSLYTRHAK